VLTGATELLELVSQAAKDKAIRPPIRGNATRLAPQRAVITVTRVTGVAPLISLPHVPTSTGTLRDYTPFPINTRSFNRQKRPDAFERPRHASTAKRLEKAPEKPLIHITK
jgi:hypothetical protein